MKKSSGFTLSEILIAMLVLGIIIAASVPVILNMTPNKNGIMMKKAYYATETIIHSLINDADYYPDKTDEPTPLYGFEDNTGVTVTGTSITAPSTYKLQCLFASKLNIKEDLAQVCAGTTLTVTTMDGMSWNLSGLSNSAADGTVQIDVDGINNGVNAYNGTNLKACSTATTWGAACNTALNKQHKKKFDRIEITISKDGKLSVKNGQDALIDIISGKTKLIGGDND